MHPCYRETETIMKIYTGQGDNGRTALFSGERVDKDSGRISTYGTFDELNSILGLALTFCHNQQVREILASIQNTLFTAGSDLATTSRKGTYRIQETDWRNLESSIDELDLELENLKDFILPGGSQGAAFLHLARTTCRRAERLLVNLMKNEEDVSTDLLVYMNRLSDLLFVLGRYENFKAGGREEIWKKAD